MTDQSDSDTFTHSDYRDALGWLCGWLASRDDADRALLIDAGVAALDRRSALCGTDAADLLNDVIALAISVAREGDG